ncbi:MAG: dethiobiotin synthase [Betaproteobacteria bacterium]|nr:dethiobiotin synthase [Betaproteobacteria bacterium]
MTATGYFITGTDTGVGKTLIACALIHAFAQQGRRVAGMKPVAAGAIRTVEGWLNEDVARLRAAANVMAPLSLINPYCFELPVAPHLAAQQAGVEIDLDVVARAYGELAAHSEIVIVEGVGGFCVPLNRNQDSADLAVRLALPVILVVGLRLGCLNHALLTAQAIRARGLVLAGWIASRIDPAMALADQNREALAARIGAPLLGDVAHNAVLMPHTIAVQLDLSKLA